MFDGRNTNISTENVQNVVIKLNITVKQFDKNAFIEDMEKINLISCFKLRKKYLD